MTGEAYDPHLERYDVAIRAAVLVARGKVQGAGAMRKQLGMTSLHCTEIQDAAFEADTLRTEDGIFILLQRCPYLMRYALELLRLYAEKYAASRSYHYRAEVRR